MGENTRCKLAWPSCFHGCACGTFASLNTACAAPRACIFRNRSDGPANQCTSSPAVSRHHFRRVVAGAAGAPPALGRAGPNGGGHPVRLSAISCAIRIRLFAAVFGAPVAGRCKYVRMSSCARIAQLFGLRLWACGHTHCSTLLCPPSKVSLARPAPAHTSLQSPTNGPCRRVARLLNSALFTFQGGFDRQLREALGPLFPEGLLPSLAEGASAAIQVRFALVAHLCATASGLACQDCRPLWTNAPAQPSRCALLSRLLVCVAASGLAEGLLPSLAEGASAAIQVCLAVAASVLHSRFAQQQLAAVLPG